MYNVKYIYYRPTTYEITVFFEPIGVNLYQEFCNFNCSSNCVTL